MLDEPTTGLDPVVRQEVLGQMLEALELGGSSIFFSSHNTQDVEQISDLITFIHRREILETDDKESFLDRWRRLSLGLDPGAFRAVILKSRGHFRAGFDIFFEPDQIYEVDAGGLTNPMLERFPFKALPRPVYPLDAKTEWRVG